MPWLGSEILGTSATVLAFASDGGGSGLPVPDIGHEFFPAPFLFQGTFFEFNRIDLVRVIATVVVVLLFWLASRNLKIVPGRGQSMAEMALSFVRVNIAEEVIGKDGAKRYVPVLTVLFFAILAMNITGVIPLLNIASTSVIATPLVMAAIALVAFIYAGIKEQGGLKFLKSTLFPPGVPWPIYIVLSPIELISTFIIRPATLTIRLLANMVAGHLLLVTFFGMTTWLFVSASGVIKGLGVLTFAAGFAFTLFEIFVAALQAYVFTLLTAVYISLSRSEH